MRYLHYIFIALSPILIIPHATGQQGSTEAMDLARKVIDAMGGQEAWDETRTLQWTFFGSRQWWWDKWTGDVRMESQRDDLRIAMNIHSREGTVFVHGQMQSSSDTLTKYLDLGYRMWINDSYWLIMPFKLLDPGVHLRLLGDGKSNDSIPCQVLELTFDNVGVTPENKYHVYVDSESHDVVQWDFYSNASDPAPRFSNAWGDYRQYGEIRLPVKRGTQELAGVAVMGKLPDQLFSDAGQPASAILK